MHKIIEVCNGDKLVLNNNSDGVEVTCCSGDGTIDYNYNISDGDIVMLLNYYVNCKTGIEKSDYISEGKIWIYQSM